MNKKILLVDDDAVMIKMVANHLESLDYDVITASDGKDGLAKLKDDINVIILDVVMPEMDGYEVYKAIKSEPKYSHIPIAICSSRVSMRDTFEALGADAFISKPIDMDKLTGTVSALTKKNILLMIKDGKLKAKIENLFPSRFNIDEVTCLKDAMVKLAQVRYSLMMVYVTTVEDDPKEFIERLRSATKNKKMTIMMYSDNMAKGMESLNTATITTEKNKWFKAKADDYFDARISEGNFSDIFKPLT